MSPHRVRKQGSRWAIVRVNPGGTTTTVGHSTSKRKARISASIRDRASADMPRRRSRRTRGGKG